jgi:hypothetical protein
MVAGVIDVVDAAPEPARQVVVPTIIRAPTARSLMCMFPLIVVLLLTNPFINSLSWRCSGVTD